MDPLDPTDSIPFADDDDDDTLTLTATPTISAPAAAFTDLVSVGGAGDSAKISKESEPLPSSAETEDSARICKESKPLPSSADTDSAGISKESEPLPSSADSGDSANISKESEPLPSSADTEDSARISKQPKPLPSSADDLGLCENGLKKNGVATEPSDTENGESAKDTSVDSTEKPMEENAVEDLKIDRDNAQIKSEEETKEHINTEACDVADKDASGGGFEDLNGEAQRASNDVTNGQTAFLTSEEGGKDGGGDVEGEEVVAEGKCFTDEQQDVTVPVPEETAVVHTVTQVDPQNNEHSVKPEDQSLVAPGETKQNDAQSDNGVEISVAMDPQGETHGGKTQESSLADDLVDDFFSPTSTTETVTNGVEDDSTTECVLHIDESVDGVVERNEGSTSGLGLGKEGSPEIIIGSVDSVENVTLKDATSEKALLGNREEEGSSSQRDSLSSRTDEEKRTSSSDFDMDFDVLELDTSHLNIAASKQKTSLRKKGSLARRKKPTRTNVTQMASDSSDSMFQDCTDSKPLMSPTSDTTEDEVFDKQAKAALSQPTEPTSTRESYTVRKAAQPFKPSLIMPGLQDLSKSKLFNQERNKSDECPTSPVKSVAPPMSPTHRPNPPVVLPKPTSKIQKDSQNKTIAAENSAQGQDTKTEDGGNVSNSSVPAPEELWISKEVRSDSASSSEGPKPARSDSASLTGPKFTRTDSWSSVSSPRRRESTSSIEGGEGGPTLPTTRRASIQGSAYAPIGFRPRRSSSIVLDSNNKLVDLLPTPASPTTTTPSSQEKESESLITSAVKSPIYTPPAWLSEMKAKTGINAGEFSARLRSTSIGSNDGSAVSTSSGRSRNSSGSAEGVQQSQSAPIGDVTQKKQEEEEPEKPSVAPLQKTLPQPPEKLPNVEENGDDDEEKRPPPPWAAELKKKNRPYISPRVGDVAAESNGRSPTSPYKASSDKENAPVVNSGRDEYSPSWMKTSQQGKKPPPPAVPTKPTVSIGSKPAVKAPPVQNPMKQYETPKWKLQLAEKKKKREAEMMPTIEGGYEPGDSSTDGGVPQWKQRLSQRKKLPQPDVVKDAEGENGGGPDMDLAKQVEERRARLMKSGLFEQGQAAEES